MCSAERQHTTTSFTVLCVAGSLAGQRFELRNRLCLGRDDTNHIQLDDDKVSRVHAEIRQVDEQFVLSDCGSANGTYVQERAVSSHGTRLAPGDRIQMGDSRFVVEGPAASADRTKVASSPPRWKHPASVVVALLLLVAVLTPILMHREHGARRPEVVQLESRARELFRTGNFVAALSELQHARELDPRDPRLPRLQALVKTRMTAAAETLLARGAEFVTAHDSTQADKAYSQMIALDPSGQLLPDLFRIARAGQLRLRQPRVEAVVALVEDPEPKPRAKPKRKRRTRIRKATPPVQSETSAAPSEPAAAHFANAATTASAETVEEQAAREAKAHLMGRYRRARALWVDWGPAYPTKAQTARQMLEEIVAAPAVDAEVLTKASDLLQRIQQEL